MHVDHYTSNRVGRYNMELPRQLTPFIGRQAELAELTARLAGADCRLISVVGAGGVGKTRLALQTATLVAADFPDGVHFVPLQTTPASQPLAVALADALQLSHAGQIPAQEQLIAYLQDKVLLLVLDNLEHLLAQVELLSDLLRAAAHMKVLVTSREVLGLQEECVFRVAGMQLPAPDAQDEVAAYDAVRFFVERVRRVNPHFALAGEEAAVIRICQLVEGIPLALELAASWAGTLDCEAIAGEIQANLGFLTSGLRNMPDRHRSMRAVFDQTWQHLSAQEQAVFKQLSVFRGNFRRSAAQAITAAKLPTLSALVNKSLLQWDASGRYHLHELLRQFAEEQLLASPEAADVQARHCAYFADFLRARLDDIHAGRQVDALQEMAAELDNLRAAWHWAATHAHVGALRRALHALVWLWQYQSRYQEAADALQLAIGALETAPPVGKHGIALAEVLVQYGWICIRLGQIEQAATILARAQTLYTQLGVAPFPDGGSDPASALAMVAVLQGDFDEAIRMLDAARAQQEARGDQRNLATTYYVLTAARLAQGDYARAEVSAHHAFHLAHLLNDRWSLAYTLNDLGRVTYLLGDVEEAKAHFRASYAIRHQYQDREGMAVALRHLGELAFHTGDLAEAARQFEESQSLYAGTGDLGGQAATWEGLANVACARGDYGTASEHLQQALQIATRLHLIPQTFSMLASSADLLAHSGQQAQAQALLRFVDAHPACPGEVKTRTRRMLKHPELLKVMSNPALVTDYRDEPLERVVANVQTMLIHLAEPRAGARARSVTPTTGPNQALIEPLTPRELDVLRLLAAGLSNRQIADTLIVAVGTVKSYTSRVYGKLGVQNRVQAIERARQLQLL